MCSIMTRLLPLAWIASTIEGVIADADLALALSEPGIIAKRVVGTSLGTEATPKLPPQAPPVFNATAESLMNVANALVEEGDAMLAKIVAEVSPENATFENVILPIAQYDDKWQSSLVYLYSYVSPNKSVRDASANGTSMLNEYSIEVNSRSDIFRLVEALYSSANKSGAASLDAESRRLLKLTYDDYIFSGLGIKDEAQRANYTDIRVQISELETQFQVNVDSEDGGMWFTSEELDGVPDSVLGNLEKGTGENSGKLRVTFQSPVLTPMMAYANNAETRRKVYVASENRIAQNSPILKEAIVLRDEAARLVGYPNHAAYQIDGRMAQTPATVNSFLANLVDNLKSRGQKETTELLELKRADLATRNLTATFDGNFFLWDWRFYDRINKEKNYKIDRAKISEYFPAMDTITTMLQIFSELFGFAFVQLSLEDRKQISPTGKGEDLTWHPDVLMFSVWDTDAKNNTTGDSGFSGYLYLDVFPRDGKSGRTFNMPIQPGFIEKDGKTRHFPCTSLVCNLSKPTGTKPSLLAHDELIAVFHELGHGIHDLSGRSTYSRFHGTRVAIDFVEAPSQMLENWCWTPSMLKRLSRHYLTNESLPDELISQIISTRHVTDGQSNLRQLALATWDMTVHTPATHEDAANLDITALYNSLRRNMTQLKDMTFFGQDDHWGRGEGTFAHPMTGYDAAYYSYLWSQVYSYDMFYAAFKADPMNGTAGRRYRHMVLEKGSTQDELLTLEQFLGRPPNAEAFYAELNITSAGTKSS